MEISGNQIEGDRFDKAAYEGQLVLFVGRTRELGIDTAYGEADATKVQLVVVFDEELKPVEVYNDQLIFGALGSNVYNDHTKTAKLGKIIQKEYDKGRGWGLEDAEDDDLAAIALWAKDAIKDNAGTYSMIDPNEKPFV